MNYLELMKKQKPDKVALVHDGDAYTYKQLVDMAVKLSGDKTVFFEKESEKCLYMIRRKKILDQLLEFLACSERNLVPILVPFDAKVLPEKTKVPENVCMAVTTSGTSGVPKVLFRTYESWADFFSVQNEIFGICENSRLFAQGSLAFTGNLNLYMAQFYAGATVVAQNDFNPKKWAEVIRKERVTDIYLIPAKLMCLPKILKEKNSRVRNILSGSQSLGKEEAEKLKEYFPKAKVILYYGASELNYITYVTDENMTFEKNLIGKPFPGVRVFVQQEEIFVDTPYHVEKISCPYTLSDKGYLDKDGNLYFNGRSDDIVGVNGRKISTFRIENELCRLSCIKESAVLLLTEKGKTRLTAFVTLRETVRRNWSEHPISSRFLGTVKEKQIDLKLREFLAEFEMPDRIVAVSQMPKNESGKILKKQLEEEWKAAVKMQATKVK